jgi:hypothetical protein
VARVQADPIEVIATLIVATEPEAIGTWTAVTEIEIVAILTATEIEMIATSTAAIVIGVGTATSPTACAETGIIDMIATGSSAGVGGTTSALPGFQSTAHGDIRGGAIARIIGGAGARHSALLTG